MRIAFLTLGCKVNSYETEKMKLQFENAGHTVVAFSEKAEVYIVNTCTVTNIADRKSRKMLHRAKRMNPEAVIVAAGCYVDSAKRKGEVDEAVDLFLSNEEKEQVVELVCKLSKQYRIAESKVKGKVSAAALAEEHTRAYIQVQNGCNQYCSYCIIPYVRGPLTSKPMAQVVEEVKRLAEQDIREVVLTGIHLSSYGIDGGDAKAFVEKQGKPLLELIEAIHMVEGIERIRLGSLEPRIITKDFAKQLAQIPEVCPHFHLSLQSGCDTVLQRMNRHYTTEEYLEKVSILRRVFRDPAITTDIIVGFPQETMEEFEKTQEYAGRVGFAQIHVFKYSRRQGTVADGMEGQIPEQEKNKRSELLLQTEKQLEWQYQELFLDGQEEVLLEEVTEISGKSYLVGYTKRYVRIAIEVLDPLEAEKQCNTIVNVRVVGHLGQEVLLGVLCEI